MKILSKDDYNKSKIELINQSNSDQIIINSYVLIRYCKISIGKCLNTKDMYILKPKDIIQVKWNYSIPTPICLKMIIQDKEHDVYWKNEKIIQWIDKNTTKIKV